MSMMQTYRNITARVDKESVIKGKEFVVLRDCVNDYHKEQLAVIPAGSVIVADFAGDFGMYGMVEVDGVIHRIKVILTELQNIDYGEFDARANTAAA